MWALTSRPIQNAQAIQLMERYKERNALQSNKWLLPRHLATLAVRPLHPAQLVLPTSSVIQLPLCAIPFGSLPHSRKREVLSLCPPPYLPPGSCLFLERSGTDMRWRPASMLECFDAAFVRSDSLAPRQNLLCAPDCASSVEVEEEVTVFNAQETNNPFLVDDDLHHRDLLNKIAIQHSLASSLTTVAAQFRYTSLDWVEAAATFQAGIRVCDGTSPHLVSCLETMKVVHILQLPCKRQRELVNIISRANLIKSMSLSFIFYQNHWRFYKFLGLTRPLLHRDVPCCPSPETQELQPLLWVAVNSNMEFYGNVTERERYIRRLYYNSQQLEVDPPPVRSS